MNSLTIAILIGVIAGVIDVIPMIIQKLDKRDSISAFCHYFVLGIIIPFVDWGMLPWLQGVIISLATAIPIMLIVSKKDKKAIAPMIVFSLILGAGIGLAGAKFIG